jgi:uncharacterized phage-associated protein
MIRSMPYHSSLAISNEFLRRAREAKRQLTHMQIQKLLYLAHGWNLAVTGRPLLEDNFEAWEFGPVVGRLYFALRKYRDQPISELVHWGDDTDFTLDDGAIAVAELSADERDVIDRVWRIYGEYPAFKLSALTHEKNSPWDKYYSPGRNQVIKEDSIYDYFADLAAR